MPRDIEKMRDERRGLLMQNLSRHLVCCLLVILWPALTASAQNAWEGKPFGQWSRADVERLLSDSPWAQTQVGQGTDVAAPYWATIRLRSALPIRQALVRRRQLLAGYDKFGDADRARFDAETREFLECPDCARHYIVTLGSPTPVNLANGVDIVYALKDASLDELKARVYLSNETGERRELVHFIPPRRAGAEAMFVFRKYDDKGKPLLTRTNKSLTFRIEEKVFEKRTTPLKKFEFNVSRLVRGGEVVF